MRDGYIYMFKNKLNQKCYVGKTINLKGRYYSHVDGSKRKSYLQKAITKYGIDNFDFVILEHIQHEDKKVLNSKLNELEIYYIKKYDSYNSGYNLTLGGDGALGAIRSEESKKAYSESKKGDKNPAKSENVKKKISNTLKQYFKEHGPHKLTEEGRERLRKNMLGEKNPMYGKYGELNPSYGVDWTKNISEEKLVEFKRKRSEASKGEKNPMYGKSAVRGKHYPKLLWVDSKGELHEMTAPAKKRYHPDWILYDDYIKIKENEQHLQYNGESQDA